MNEGASLTPLGGPFDLVSRVSKVGYGDYGFLGDTK